MLYDFRARVAVFVLVALVLGAGVLMSLRQQSMPTENISAEQPTQSAALVPPEGEVPSRPSGQSGSPSPAQPLATPSGEPSVIGAPDAENPDAAKGPLMKVTTKETVAFLKVFNTFNWQENPENFVERVIAVGAVPGSAAALPPYSGAALEYCVESYCATDFISAENIKIGKGALITASVSVRFSQFGKVSTQVLSCELVRAPAKESAGGLFVDAFCLGPNG